MKEPTFIRAYLRSELESLIESSRLGLGPFTTAEIESELTRRDTILELRKDTLHYPELSHS